MLYVLRVLSGIVIQFLKIRFTVT